MSGARNDGGPAFPVADVPMAEPDSIDEGRALARGGISVRDYFAAQVLSNLYIKGSAGDLEAIAEVAFGLADAMLAERAK